MRVVSTAGPYRVTERDLRPTAAGWAIRVQVERHDGKRIRYRPLQDLVNRLYPGRWAVMSFPSANHLFDDVNRYHLLVFDTAPAGFDFFDPPPAGTETA